MGSKIYTGKGDQGTTSLLSGKRVPKDDPRVQAYGALDELQAHLGIARALLKTGPIAEVIFEIQNDIFLANAELSWEGSKSKLKDRLSNSSVEKLERWIDLYTKRCPLNGKFIVPGASHESAILHVARTVCRKGERLIVGVNREHGDFDLILVYVNRLSDLLFIISWNLEVESEITEAVLKTVLSETK